MQWPRFRKTSGASTTKKPTATFKRKLLIQTNPNFFRRPRSGSVSPTIIWSSTLSLQIPMGLLGTSPTLSLREMLWISKRPTDSASPHSFFRNSFARFWQIATSVAMTWRRVRKSKCYLKSSSPKLMGHWHWMSVASWWRNSQIPSQRSRNDKG